MNKKVIASLVIAFLLISSIFGFVLSYQAQDTSVKYGKYRFNIIQNQYITNIDGKKMSFLMLPFDVESINISEAKSLLQKEVWTVSYDQNSSFAEALADAQYYLEYQLEGKRIIERALLEDGQLPKRTCMDATDVQLVIELREANESDIVVSGNCIIISSFEPIDVYRQTERVVYDVLGVMQ